MVSVPLTVCSSIWCVPHPGDSSEEEEEGESGVGEDNTTFICGLGVKMRVVKDGKYRCASLAQQFFSMYVTEGDHTIEYG